MQGVVAIELSNGQSHHILDLLGRGSVLQIQNVLFDEQTYYQARAVSSRTVILKRIDKKWIFSYAYKNTDFKNVIRKFEDYCYVFGIPQIDYQICNERQLGLSENHHEIIFKKQQLWFSNKMDDYDNLFKQYIMSARIKDNLK